MLESEVNIEDGSLCRLKKIIADQEKEIVEMKAIIEKLQMEINNKDSKKQLEVHNLQCVIDEMPGSIYWKNKEGVYLGCNLFAMDKMKSINLPWTSILGRTDYDLFTKETADQYRAHDLKVMNEGCELSTEENVVLPSGETLIQFSSKRPLWDKDGKVNGVIGNTIDITYLKKKVVVDLSVAKEKLEKISRSKTEMIRHMEHDIRTPFYGIWVLASMLESKEIDLEKKQFLGDISTSAKALLDYCNLILELIKSDTSTAPVLKVKFNLKVILDSVIAIEISAAKSKNLKLELNYDTHIPEVLIGDPNRIQRILLNLISNAIKLTEIGYIKVSVVCNHQGDSEKLNINLIIEDSGVGILTEDLSVLMCSSSKFIDYSSFLEYKKNGLGLSVVKQLINELQGEISAGSQKGKGTTFICKIPLNFVD